MPLAASSISSPFSLPECLDGGGGYGLLYVCGFFVLLLFFSALHFLKKLHLAFYLSFC